MSTFTLHIQYVNRLPETRTFSQFRLAIGRTDGDLCLHDPKVSSQHGEIRFHGGVLQYTDLGSTNGTFTKDGKAVQNLELQPGMSLRLGNSILTVQDIDIPQTAQRGSTVFMTEENTSSPQIFEPSATIIKPSAYPAPQPAVHATVIKPHEPAPSEGTMFIAVSQPDERATPPVPAFTPAAMPNLNLPMDDEEATLIFHPPGPADDSKNIGNPIQAPSAVGKTVLRPSTSVNVNPTLSHAQPTSAVEQHAHQPTYVPVVSPASAPVSAGNPFFAMNSVVSQESQEDPWTGLGSELSADKIKRTLIAAWNLYKPVLVPATLIVGSVTVVGALLSTVLAIIPVVGTILSMVMSLLIAVALVYAIPALGYFMICAHVGQPVNWMDAWKKQLANPVEIGLNYFVASLIAVVASVFLFVPGIFLGCFIAHILVLEDKKFLDINLRNLELVKHEWITVISLFLIAAVGIGLVTAIPIGILQWLVGFLTGISAILGFFARLIVNPLVNLVYAVVIGFMMALGTKIYFALRQNYEGIDLRTLAKEKLGLEKV